MTATSSLDQLPTSWTAPPTDHATVALRELTAGFGVLAQAVPQAVIAIDLLGRVTSWNAAAERLFGWRAEEVLGRPEPTIPSGPLGDFAPEIRATSLGAGVTALETRRQRKDGSLVDVSISEDVLRDAARTPIGSIAVITDITERKRAERLLLESEDRFRRLVEAAPDGIVVCRDGRLLFANQAAARLIGATGPAEVVGLDLVSLVPEETRAGVVASLQRVVREGATVEVRDHELVRLDGRPITADVTATPLLYQGEPAMQVIVRDVGDRRRAEERRRRREQEFAALVEQAPDVIVRIDRESRLRYVNAAIEQVIGLAPREVIGRLAHELGASSGFWGAWKDAVARVVATGAPQAVEHAYPTPGGPRWYHTRLVPELDRDGEVESVLAIARDVSERQELEERLRHAQKLEAVAQLAGGIAHEFNNALTIVTSYGGVLYNELPAASRLRADVGEIQAAANRAAALTQQLLAFSRRQAPQATLFDVNDAVAGMERMLARIIGEDVALTVTRSAEPALVFADRAHVEQVVVTLAVNAREAMPAGGRLTIAVERGAAATADVALRVTDTGIGMDAATVARVFEPFFTTKAQRGHSGLGLAMTYGMVEQARGRIAVASTPGVGSSFTVILPAPAPRDDAAWTAAAPATPSPHRGLATVLVVEDEPAVRAIVQRLLAGRGHDVLLAADGAEAIDVAGRHGGPIHLVVSDVVMPLMRGPELVEHLVALRPDLRVLFMTGHAAAGTGVPLPHGTRLLKKPFAPEELLAAVDAALDGAPAAAASPG